MPRQLGCARCANDLVASPAPILGHNFTGQPMTVPYVAIEAARALGICTLAGATLGALIAAARGQRHAQA